MLNDLLNRLLGEPQSSLLPPEDCRLALTALMVRIAHADERYDAAEAAMIDQVIGQRYGLDKAGQVSLREEAEALEAQTGDTVRLTNLIKQAVPYEDRTGVVEALWSVALADGSKDAEEAGLIRLIASLVGVSDQDSGLARQRVIARRAQT